MPLVSIVLPVRNAAATLPRAVASLQRQTLTDWELVAVDDGSTDATPALLAALARTEPRLRVLTPGRVGLVAALNFGLAAAGGPLIARMDADDEAHPERLAAQAEFLRVDPAAGLAGCLVDYGGDRAKNAGYALHVDWINSLVTPEAIALNRFVESPFAHPSVMFRRGLVACHGGYREGDFPEDYELWLRWLGAGVRMVKVPRTLLTWHDPAGRLSRTDPRYAPEAFIGSRRRMWLANCTGGVTPGFGSGGPGGRRASGPRSSGRTASGSTVTWTWIRGRRAAGWAGCRWSRRRSCRHRARSLCWATSEPAAHANAPAPTSRPWAMPKAGIS